MAWCWEYDLENMPLSVHSSVLHLSVFKVGPLIHYFSTLLFWSFSIIFMFIDVIFTFIEKILNEYKVFVNEYKNYVKRTCDRLDTC